MPTCKCPGRMEVGKLAPYNGTGRGQTQKIAWHNLFRKSGMRDGYITLMSLALEYDCAGECQIRTGYSITPPAQFVLNPNDKLWYATFTNAKLTVWVECVKPISG